jgi:hypothetical protein
METNKNMTEENRNMIAAVKPLPYYQSEAMYNERVLAEALRREFVPKIARRLPGHHLKGFTHDFIIGAVKKYKARYPYFLKTDIAKFYPSIRHRDLVSGVQLAFRDLLSLDYVPASFKKKYMGALNGWCRSQPLMRGIPLGSAVSAIAAPLMLVPLWLQLKRQFRVPFIVFMDDLLVMAENPSQLNEIYRFLVNTLLADYDLSLNMEKTKSGRFSRESVDFCGWHFAGGYASVSPEKAEAFKTRLSGEANRDRKSSTEAFIKRINRSVDGFGNYYKHGDVGKQFEALDVHVRSLVRRRLTGRARSGTLPNTALEKLGLHSLTAIYLRRQAKAAERSGRTAGPGGRRLTPAPRLGREPASRPAAPALAPDGELLHRMVDICEKIHAQFTQMLALQRKLARMIERITSP